MESVQINTAQNVAIDYEIAGLGDRILAALIDYFVLAGYIIGISLLSNIFDSILQGSIVVMTIILLPYVCYDLACEIFMNGQSIGKRAMKIRVVKLDDSQPGIGDYLLRWLFRLIDVSILAGAVAIFTILINGKGQRLGDLAAGTTVIKMKSNVKLKDTILAQLEVDYQPTLSQVVLLNDSDIAIIKKVLHVKIENTKIANHLAFKTKTALENKMGIKSDMLAGDFLETVLKDYNALLGS